MSHNNFQHLNTRAQRARTFIAITIGCNCLVALGVFVFSPKHSIDYGYAAFQVPFIVRGLLQFVDIIVQLFAGFFFLTWQEAAIKNAKKLNPEIMKTSTTKAVVAWILPIYCLYKPYFVMKELWAATILEPNQGGIKPSLPQPLRNTLITWWLMWLLPSGIGAGIAGALEANGIRGYAEIVLAASKIVGVVVSGYMIMQIITRITMDQDRAFAQRQLDTSGEPAAVNGPIDVNKFQNSNDDDPHTIHLNKPNTVER